MVDAYNTCIVQGSTVLGKSLKGKCCKLNLTAELRRNERIAPKTLNSVFHRMSSKIREKYNCIPQLFGECQLKELQNMETDQH